MLHSLVILNAPHPAFFGQCMLMHNRLQALNSWYMAYFQLPIISDMYLYLRPEQFISEAFHYWHKPGQVLKSLVAPAPSELRVRFTCHLTDDALRIVAERLPATPLGEVGELSTIILGAIVDEATIEAPAGRITITKRSDPGG